MRFSIIFGLLLLLASPAFAAPCPREVESMDLCFRASGRIHVEAGARPTIWLPKQDNARFGISSTVSQSPEQYDWPQNVQDFATPGADIWGNYVICPQSDPDEPGVQMVCIRTGLRLRAYE